MFEGSNLNTRTIKVDYSLHWIFTLVFSYVFFFYYLLLLLFLSFSLSCVVSTLYFMDYLCFSYTQRKRMNFNLLKIRKFFTLSLSTMRERAVAVLFLVFFFSLFINILFDSTCSARNRYDDNDSILHKSSSSIPNR